VPGDAAQAAKRYESVNVIKSKSSLVTLILPKRFSAIVGWKESPGAALPGWLYKTEKT
jgi:hypothetical protein